MAYEQNGHGGSVAGGGRGRIQSHHPHQQQIGRGGHGHARGQQGSRAVSHPQYSQRDSSGRVTTAAQLLERRLTEEDSAKRIAIASQFTLLVNNAPTGSELADPRNIEYLFRSEQGVIEALLSEVRMVTALKQSFTHAVAAIGLAFQSEPGPFYGYVFERLLSLNQIASGEHERELKMSWLVVLKEVLEASVVPYPSNPLWSHNMIAKILQDTQVFLDTMEGPEYLPKVLDILSIIYDRYSEPFKMAFKDLIAVLVGWHIDPSLPKNLSRIIRDSLRRFSKIWRDRARFGLDLMKNLFADMETELQAVKSTPNPRLSLKLHNLFRCHITVTQCLCHAFFSTVNPETTQAAEANQFILQEFCGLLAAQLEFLNTVSSSELRDKDWWLEGV
ncbi:hypothetical protein DFJ73DRAFT_812549 [Zopfochytrium polystomum]|nr:hypothetical protein DFJ73DRAFT_812549 [Zopfochytrium polystomum]